MHAYEIFVSFEVNVGIVAACTPVMKPFFRYVKARITGKDPHDMIGPSTTQRSFHSSWFSRLWPSHSSPVRSQQGHRNLFHRASPESETKDISLTTNATLNLPLQGIRQPADVESLPRHLGAYDSKSTLRNQAEDVGSVEDRV